MAYRSIPTPVGNTLHAHLEPGETPAHPHARGEHTFKPVSARARSGPSPRPWGTQVDPVAETEIGRSIPTPVGNTRPLDWLDRPVSVHPHARGEHLRPVPRRAVQAGPSPRPWGTLPDHVDNDGVVRSIPTPVGNTDNGRLHRFT